MHTYYIPINSWYIFWSTWDLTPVTNPNLFMNSSLIARVWYVGKALLILSMMQIFSFVPACNVTPCGIFHRNRWLSQACSVKNTGSSKPFLQILYILILLHWTEIINTNPFIILYGIVKRSNSAAHWSISMKHTYSPRVCDRNRIMFLISHFYISLAVVIQCCC